MKMRAGTLCAVVAAVCVAGVGSVARAGVEVTDLSLNGKAIGVSIAPQMKHIAVLAQQGSKYAVYMDGQAGPKIEAMCWTGGAAFNANSAGGWVGQVPVLFDDTGEHWAYAYKDGADTVIVEDGKELARGPMQPQLQMPVQFSRGGKYIAWAYDNQVFINGKPGPKSRGLPALFFSPDGSRYAYVGTEVGKSTQWAVVDGKQVNYFGDIDQFTANNHLLAVLRDPAARAETLSIDGKPEIKAANIRKLWTSADGKTLAIALTPAPNEKTVLSVNGKNVPGTEGVSIVNVWFSPDGKRWAAHCSANGQQFMIIDGKKQDSYGNLPEQIAPYDVQRMQWIDPAQANSPNPVRYPAFTSDSSKFVYEADATGQHFLMTDDGENDDFMAPLLVNNLVVSSAGGHYGFLGIAPNKKQGVVINDKAYVIGPPANSGQLTLSGLAFSPDGSRWGVLSGLGNTTLYVDGQAMAGNITGQRYLFSPDSKHVMYMTQGNTLALDGKIIPTMPAIQMVSFPLFSPDSRHVYWVRSGRLDNTKDQQELYVDGKAVTHFDDAGFGNGVILNKAMSPDGVLTLITRTEGVLTKFVVTPEGNVDGMMAGAKAAQ